MTRNSSENFVLAFALALAPLQMELTGTSVTTAVPAFLQQMMVFHTAAAAAAAAGATVFRVFGIVTKLHTNATTGEVYGGLCTMEPRSSERLTISFNAASFAHRLRPLHAGPVELPCSVAADVKLGVVLYGVAARSVDGRCTFRACTEGAALLSLVRLLQSDRKDVDAVWAARADLQLRRAPDRADELVLLGLVLVGDLVAVVQLAEDASAGAGAGLKVGETWRCAPDEFVRCVALMSSSPILLQRLHHFVVSRCERTVSPVLQRRLRTSVRVLTSKNLSLLRSANEQKFAALEDDLHVRKCTDRGGGSAAESDSEEEWSC